MNFKQKISNYPCCTNNCLSDKSIRYPLFLLLILASIWTLGCERIALEDITTTIPYRTASANISSLDESNLAGVAMFTETEDGVHVLIEVQNAKPGLHAAHLHIGPSCDDIGPHWHPAEVPIGNAGVSIATATVDMPPIGIGEIGNISVDEDGSGILEVTTPFWSIGGDVHTDILGKLILIHETGDTFRTHPHGTHIGVSIHVHPNQDTVNGHEMPVSAHVCTLAVLGQQIDLEMEHHLPGEVLTPHSHDLLELLLNCFVSSEELLNPETLLKIPLQGSTEYHAFLNIELKTLAAYHEFFITLGLPIDPEFFTNQYREMFPTGTPNEYEQEMQARLTHLYISSGIDYENPNDMMGYSQLVTNFLDDRTTAWVLGYFEGDDNAFDKWILSVLKSSQVRPGGGARIGCGVITLRE